MFDYLTKLIKRDQNSIYHNEIISVKSSYSIVCDTDFKLTMNLCTIKASMNFSKNFSCTVSDSGWWFYYLRSIIWKWGIGKCTKPLSDIVPGSIYLVCASKYLGKRLKMKIWGHSSLQDTKFIWRKNVSKKKF